MNLSDLPTFTPSTFPPSAFNYERPRHFIQSQPTFQAPSYESVVREARENENNCQQSISSPQNYPTVMETESQMTVMSTQCQSSQTQSKSLLQTQSSFQSLSLSPNQTQSLTPTQANGTGKSSPSSSSLSSPISTPASSAPPPISSTAPLLSPFNSASSSSSPLSAPSFTLPRTTMRSTITLTPSVPSATGLGSACLPANQEPISAPAAYLCSVLPSQSAFSPFSSSKLSPNSTLPRPSTPASCSPLSPSSPLLPVRASSSPSSLPQSPLPVSPSILCSPLSPSSSSSSHPLANTPSPSRVPPAVVSLPTSYKGTPNM